MAEAPLPWAGYCKLVGQLLLATADTNVDPDKFPDGIFAQGTIVLTPKVTNGFIRFPGTTVGQAVLPKPIVIVLDSESYITVNGDRDVYIPPTDDPASSPIDWTWEAKFDVHGPDGIALPISSYSFSAPMGTTVKLFSVAPVASGGGVLTVQGPSGFSAYQLAVQNGFVGDMAAWLASVTPSETFVKDTFALDRLDRERVDAELDRSWAARDFLDAENRAYDWSSKTEGGAVFVPTNGQISNNRVYATSSTGAGGVNIPVSVLPGEKFHAQFLTYFKAGGATPFYWGIDCNPAGTVPDASAVNSFLFGINSANVKGQFIGGSVSGLAAHSAVFTVGPTGPTVDTTYQCSIDIDELYVHFTMRPVGSTTDIASMTIRRSILEANSKPIANIRLSNVDARALTGNAYGPLVYSRSGQPSRQRVAGGQTVEGAEHSMRLRIPTGGSTERYRLRLPKTYDPRVGVDLVVFAHQTVTGADYTPDSEARMQPVTAALLNAGFGVLSLLDGAVAQDRFGNQTALDTHLAAINWARNNFSTNRLLALTASGGAFPILNMMARRVAPSFSAIAMIGPGIDMAAVFNGPDQATFRPLLRAAYGIAGDDSDYASKTAGFDPMMNQGKAYRGIPFLFMTSDADTVAPKSAHVTPFAAKIAPYVPEATVVTKTGGHLDISQYDVATIVPFLQKYASQQTTPKAPADNLPLLKNEVFGKFARLTRPLAGLMGDSIINQNMSIGSPGVYLQANGFVNVALTLTRQRFTIVQPSPTDIAWGGSGQQALDMITNGEMAAMAAADFDLLIEQSGTNDVGAGRTAAQVADARETIWNAALATGKTVVACAIIPRNINSATDVITQAVRDANRECRKRARAKRGVVWVDLYTPLLDPTTSLSKTAYLSDTIHPNPNGAFRMGAVLAQTLDRIYPPDGDALLMSDNSDNKDLLSNGLLLGTGGSTSGSGISGSVATGCTAYVVGAPTSVVMSKVARTDLVLGEWQQAVVTTSNPKADGVQLQQQNTNVGVDWNVGDTVQCAIEFETDAAGWSGYHMPFECIPFGASGGGVALRQAGSEITAATEPLYRLPSGVLLSPPWVIPSGTTRLQCNAYLRGGGTIRWSRMQLWKV